MPWMKYWIKVGSEWLSCSKETFDSYYGEKYYGTEDMRPQTNPGLLGSITYDRSITYDPCRYCSNNPANGGTGICNCTLGQWRVTC